MEAEAVHHETRQLSVEHTTSTAHRLSRYEGNCGNIHGHNMRWEIDATVDMEGIGGTNMPVDFKDVKDVVDENFDHACILSRKELYRLTKNENPVCDFNSMEEAEDFVERFFGKVYWVSGGDPTCEHLCQLVGEELCEIPRVVRARVKLYETDKYAVNAHVESSGIPKGLIKQDENEEDEHE